MGVKRMTNIGNVRKLKKEEHILTRPLWEKVFSEDSKEFLDYYYLLKTKDNEIYVIEDSNQIVAMLHLNPYQMRIGTQLFDTHYIVAVATDENYRRQGLMSRLMEHVLDVMTKRGEPFTFLMPANEAYYIPFGFVSIQKKKECLVSKEPLANSGLTFQFARENDCEEMANFANDFLLEYDVSTYRTTSYYQRLLAEHTCEKGGILIVKKEDKIVGLIPYFGTEAREVKGPMLLSEAWMKEVAFYLLNKDEEQLKVTEYPFMIKILDSKYQNLFKTAKVFMDEVV